MLSGRCSAGFGHPSFPLRRPFDTTSSASGSGPDTRGGCRAPRPAPARAARRWAGRAPRRALQGGIARRTGTLAGANPLTLHVLTRLTSGCAALGHGQTPGLDTLDTADTGTDRLRSEPTPETAPAGSGVAARMPCHREEQSQHLPNIRCAGRFIGPDLRYAPRNTPAQSEAPQCCVPLRTRP